MTAAVKDEAAGRRILAEAPLERLTVVRVTPFADSEAEEVLVCGPGFETARLCGSMAEARLMVSAARGGRIGDEPYTGGMVVMSVGGYADYFRVFGC